MFVMYVDLMEIDFIWDTILQLDPWSFNYQKDIKMELEESNGQKHPTAEQLLLRMAVEKALMNKQRKVWELYNYDRFTQAEIAKKLKCTQQAIDQQIKVIEKQLTKWIKEHSEVYEALKEAEADGC